MCDDKIMENFDGNVDWWSWLKNHWQASVQQTLLYFFTHSDSHNQTLKMVFYSLMIHDAWLLYMHCFYVLVLPF